jgi:hypothetical protein
MHLLTRISSYASAIAVAGVCFGLVAPVAAQKKGSTAVPLRVIVQPVDSAGTFMQTTGDSGPTLPSEYVHGVDDVYAVLNDQGGLTVDFQPTASSPRQVYFDYSQPIGDATAPPASIPTYSGLRTHLTASNTPLQDMAVPSTQCIPLGTAFIDGAGTQYRNSYQARNIVSVDTSATAFGTITRLDANTWLLESGSGLCNNANAHITKLIKNVTSRGKTTYADQGAFVLGFSMRLIRK